MRLKNILLAGVIITLAATSFISTYKAHYYQDLYQNNPRVEVKVEKSTAQVVEYSNFNPDRSEAYTCKTQKMGNVGMVCISPDSKIIVNCTTTVGDPTVYYC